MRLRVPSSRRRITGPRRGFALVAVLLIAMIATVIALASATMAMSGRVIQSGSDRVAEVDDAAITAIEEERSRLNAKIDSIPLTGFATIESDYPIPGTNLRRSIWVSRLGNSDSLHSAGEFGVQAEVVAKVVDNFGNVAIRRAQMFQESFARYASFTDHALSTAGYVMWWALGAQALGPVHSNEEIYVWNGVDPSPQATFFDNVTTARTIVNKEFASFRAAPPQENVARIAMPGTADLDVLRSIAGRAGYVFTPSVVGGDSALATMRIEFVAIDADGDGNTTGPDDGYFRVYQLKPTLPFGAGYAVARPASPPPSGSGAPTPLGEAGPVDSTLYSHNCGVTALVGGRTATPVTFADIPHRSAGTFQDRMLDKAAAFDDPNARCFLGGDERLQADGLFKASDSAGFWMPRTSGSVPSSVASRPDGAYLWPLNPAYNTNFRGVIFAEGNVAVSGVVRGRLTVVSRNMLIVAHNLTQATSPAVTTGACSSNDDVIGLFSGAYVLYADNAVSTPQWRRTGVDGESWLLPRKDFDPSSNRPDMQVQAALLALKSVAAENASPPIGYPAGWWVDRGTTRLIGGTVESYGGQTSTLDWSGNVHGYHDDISFNRCMLHYPPPYFPTTGHWTRSQFYEVNPNQFSPSSWFTGR